MTMSSKLVIATAAAWVILAGAAARAESTSATPVDAKSAAATKSAGEEKSAGAASTEAKMEKRKPTKAELRAFLAKCSQEADEKGLTPAKHKLAERKAYRRQCMAKFGVEAKAAD